MRIWIRFNKGEELKYLSHLDLMRVWQRALRRAALPVAYSAGFNPQMRMSFASALSVGVTSAAEYVDIIFTRHINQDEWTLLDQVLPSGLEIQSFREIPAQIPALMALVGAAFWSVPLDGTGSMFFAIQGLLGSATLPVQREGKKGKKTVDLRPLILQLNLVPKNSSTHLNMLLATGGQGSARPQEVLSLLGLPADGLQKTAMLLKIGDTFQEPFDVAFIKNEVQTDAKKDSYKL